MVGEYNVKVKADSKQGESAFQRLVNKANELTKATQDQASETENLVKEYDKLAKIRFAGPETQARMAEIRERVSAAGGFDPTVQAGVPAGGRPQVPVGRRLAQGAVGAARFGLRLAGIGTIATGAIQWMGKLNAATDRMETHFIELADLSKRFSDGLGSGSQFIKNYQQNIDELGRSLSFTRQETLALTKDLSAQAGMRGVEFGQDALRFARRSGVGVGQAANLFGTGARFGVRDQKTMTAAFLDAMKSDDAKGRDNEMIDALSSLVEDSARGLVKLDDTSVRGIGAIIGRISERGGALVGRGGAGLIQRIGEGIKGGDAFTQAMVFEVLMSRINDGMVELAEGETTLTRAIKEQEKGYLALNGQIIPELIKEFKAMGGSSFETSSLLKRAFGITIAQAEELAAAFGEGGSMTKASTADVQKYLDTTFKTDGDKIREQQVRLARSFEDLWRNTEALRKIMREFGIFTNKIIGGADKAFDDLVKGAVQAFTDTRPSDIRRSEQESAARVSARDVLEHAGRLSQRLPRDQRERVVQELREANIKTIGLQEGGRRAVVSGDFSIMAQALFKEAAKSRETPSEVSEDANLFIVLKSEGQEAEKVRLNLKSLKMDKDIIEVKSNNPTPAGDFGSRKGSNN